MHISKAWAPSILGFHHPLQAFESTHPSLRTQTASLVTLAVILGDILLMSNKFMTLTKVSGGREMFP